jgi:hypothetical protein
VCQAIGARTLAENTDIISRHKLTACRAQTVSDIDAIPTGARR